MNTRATKEMLDAEQYDAIIIAIGSEPIIPKNIPGIDLPHVAWAPDAEEGKIPVGDKVVIIGGGSVGMEAMIEFGDMGKQVELLEMGAAENGMMQLRKSAGSSAGEMLNICKEKNYQIHYSTKLTAITEKEVIAENLLTGETVTFPADTVLLALGMKSLTEEAESMRHCAPETEIFVIGDAKRPAQIGDAVNEAFRACIHI